MGVPKSPFVKWAIRLTFGIAIGFPGAEDLQAQGFENTIMTGVPEGTNYKIGQDLNRVVGQCGLPLEVRESAGSLENFLGVRQGRYIQFGIVQSDVLEYLKTYAGENREMARVVAGMKVALPLYDEEVHLLAKREIASLRDLDGRSVSVGVQDSGSFLTSSLVLDLAGVAPENIVELNAPASLEALLAGDIDAFFYVSGSPTPLFQTNSIDRAAYHLVPIDNPTLRAVYAPAIIEAGTYPFHDQDVEVVAVQAVLMTYEFDPSVDWYHRSSCKAVSDLVNIVANRFDWLKASGHPKWREVDLSALPEGWNVSRCAAAGLSSAYSTVCEQETTPVPDEFQNDINAIYRQRICSTIGC